MDMTPNHQQTRSLVILRHVTGHLLASAQSREAYAQEAMAEMAALRERLEAVLPKPHWRKIMEGQAC